MNFRAGESFKLQDVHGTYLGDVYIENEIEDVIFGRFLPGDEFDPLAALFDSYVNAANDQLFTIVDDLERQIDQMGLQLDGQPPIVLKDVQIGAGSVNFRLASTCETAVVNGDASGTRRAIGTISAN